MLYINLVPMVLAFFLVRARMEFMKDYFVKAYNYLSSSDISITDPLDIKTYDLLNNEQAYEKASQALRRRFARGASEVEGVDRSFRRTKIKREGGRGNYHYFVKGADGSWNEPDERIWVVAMYALWQENK